MGNLFQKIAERGPWKRSAAIHRKAARVLPVSPEGRVLLLQWQDPGLPGKRHWVSIGGAVDAGESLPEAAVRELWEETGIVAEPADLVGPLHRASQPFRWDGQAYVNDSHFFAMPLPEYVPVSFDGLEPAEVGNVFAARWWTPDELADDGTAASEAMLDVMRLAIGEIKADA